MTLNQRMNNNYANLLDFELQLKRSLGDIQNPRPFVCEGNPLDCELFLIGFNAATEMKASFWSFWSSERGFDRSSWYETYIKERAEKPLRPGRTRRLQVSTTRRCIELIVNELKPIRCLETNLYMTATAQANELGSELMDASTFNFLVTTIKPRVLLLHGLDARQQLEKLASCTLQPNMANSVVINGSHCIVFPVKHLSRGWSKQHCIALGQQLASLARTQNCVVF